MAHLSAISEQPSALSTDDSSNGLARAKRKEELPAAEEGDGGGSDGCDGDGGNSVVELSPFDVIPPCRCGDKFRRDRAAAAAAAAAAAGGSAADKKQ